MFQGTTSQRRDTVVPPADPGRKRWRGIPRWIVVAVAIVLIGALGFGLGLLTRSDDASDLSVDAPAGRGANDPPFPASPDNPSARVLSGLVVRQRDVRGNLSVQLLPDGDEVQGQATLDLCNGTYPSESLRTERLQVVVVDAQATVPLSTEAVMYENPAATTQAFAELASVAANCPSTPVPSPVGGTTATTRFLDAPDGAWPQTPSVDRLAYRFTTTTASTATITGETRESVAVYLRRGRVLMGLYFPQPNGPQPPVVGLTTIPEIVSEFAGRIAQLPQSVVDG